MRPACDPPNIHFARSPRLQIPPIRLSPAEMVGKVLKMMMGYGSGARSHHFGLESGGHSDPATIGFPPLCTVGAAELEPPALGRIALFPTAMDVFSSALADVPERDVVQLVAGFWLDGVVDWAAKGSVDDQPKKHAAAMRNIVSFITGGPSLCKKYKLSVDVIVPSRQNSHRTQTAGRNIGRAFQAS